MSEDAHFTDLVVNHVEVAGLYHECAAKHNILIEFIKD